ncbi:MAG: LytR/AlgR family response regulator transcription factor [Gemmatimonadaceae bacterium]
MSHSVPDAAAQSLRPRVIIVDDEPLARDCIRLPLEREADAEIVAECGDGASAVDAIRRLSPDIVFLDVQMPELDGFGVIDHVGAAAMPPVVFVTAYDEHALRAFEVHALDYVLKPFDDARLLAAFDHARLVMLDRQHGELGRKLAEVVRNWQQVPASPAAAAPTDVRGKDAERDANSPNKRSGYITRFTVREDGNARFVPASVVDWIEADGNYIVLCVGETRHKVRGTLRDVSGKLDPRLFVRIHRSVIVNIDRIRELQPWFGGDYVAILRNGAKLKVSRRHVSQLLRPMA